MRYYTKSFINKGPDFKTMDYQTALELLNRLNRVYPNEVYIWVENFLSFSIYAEPIYHLNGNKGPVVYRFNASSQAAVNSAHLRRMMIGPVFDTRGHEVGARMAIVNNELKPLHPTHQRHVFIINKASTQVPILRGPVKGYVQFWEPELGNHVVVAIS